ncbi:MAG: hypothetical protein ACRD0N_04725, partial [Acidimicrobiales bacterium]
MPGRPGSRSLPEPLVIALTWLADAGEFIFGRLRHYGGGPLQRSASATGPTRAALVAAAGAAGRSAAHARQRLAVA